MSRGGRLAFAGRAVGGAGVMHRGRGLDTLQGAASHPALHVRVGAHRPGCESAVSHGHEAPCSVR